MDEKRIIELYSNGYTLRHISEILNSNHHTIRRILVKNGIEITRRNTLKSFTEERRQKISEACKGRSVWSKGLKMSREHTLKNMRAHLKYDVSLEWLYTFESIEKLKYLNRSLSRRRDYEGFTTESYILYIEKFYYDEKFNELFDKWVLTGDRWIKPSLDHIKAKTNGGSLLIENLQFISWFENRAKSDIEQSVWSRMKENINYYL